MECNLEQADRTLRMTIGVFLILGALLAGTLSYLELTDTWWFIVAGSLLLLGIGAVLSAIVGKCALRRIIGH